MTVLLARTSPPSSVNRVARAVNDLAEDVEARVKKVERAQHETEAFVDGRLEEIEALAGRAKKRLAGARRAEQAQEAAGGDGGLPPIGHPDRPAALERAFGGAR